MKSAHPGDKGKTSVLSKKVGKTDCSVDALGNLDELNSFIGLCRAFNKDGMIDGILERVQKNLFVIGSELSLRIAGQKTSVAGRKDMAGFLDEKIAEIENPLPELGSFILPGGTQASALLHVARCVCRRAERSIAELSKKVDVGEDIMPYINRLSDMLFDLARYVNNKEGVKEIEWDAG